MPTGLQHVEKPLRDLRKALKNLSAHPQPEEVHELRTRARRVEAIAAACAGAEGKLARRLVRSIKPLRKAAGAVRDMDVLTANVLALPRGTSSASLVRLVENLGSVRRAYANALLRAVSRRRKEACRNLEEFSRIVRKGRARNQGARENGVPPSAAETALRSAASSLARKLSRWPELDERNLHLFRIKVKQLRSILQLLADSDPALVEALGTANARIGDWHDWHHLKEIAEIVPGEPLERALLGRIGRTAKRKLTQALAAAHALRASYLQTVSRRAGAAKAGLAPGKMEAP
jgi:CHAD domain-containing protein